MTLYSRFLTSLLVAALLPFTFLKAQEAIELTPSEINTLYKTKAREWASVHDPSVVYSTGKTFIL